MNDSIRYADYWTEGRGPSAVTWIDTAEAERRYVSGSASFTAVGRPTGAASPRWALTVAATRAVRVVFLNDHGSRVRSIDYDWREGRLWRWITTDFEYPEQCRRFRREHALRVTTATCEPDGRARAEIVDKSVSTDLKDVISFEDAPINGFWLDRPGFVSWADLVDPEYGVQARPRP